jgi:hypothetical protein
MALTNPSAINPTAVVGAANQGLLSTLDLITPNYYEKYVDKYKWWNDYYMITTTLAGKETFSPNQAFSHVEPANRRAPYVLVASVSTETPAAGAAVTVTIDSSFVFDSSSPLRVGEIVEIANNTATAAAIGVQGQITAVNSDTECVVKPLLSTQSFSCNGAETNLLFRGRAVGEASEVGGSLQRQDITVNGLCTEVREDYTTTDRALAERVFPENTVGAYSYRGIQTADMRFMDAREAKHMFGTESNNSGVSQTSAGLVPQIIDGGIAVTYSSFDATALDNIAKGLDKEVGANEYHWLMDTNQYIAVQNFIQNKYNAGAINYGSFNGSKEIAIAQGFTSYTIHGRTFHMKKYMGFNAGAQYGVASSKWDDNGVLIPMDSQRDAASGESVNSFGLRYQLYNGQRFYKFDTGGLAKVPTSGKMELTISHIAKEGLQVFGVNRFARVYKA